MPTGSPPAGLPHSPRVRAGKPPCTSCPRLLVLSAWGLMTSCSAGLLFTPPHCLQPLPRAHDGPLHPSSRSCSETLKERRGGEAPLGRTDQNTHFCCPGAEHVPPCWSTFAIPWPGTWQVQCGTETWACVWTWKDRGVCREHSWFGLGAFPPTDSCDGS